MKTKITHYTFFKSAKSRGRKWLLGAALLLGSNYLGYTASAQSIEWQKYFKGNDADILNVVKVTSDGGYILGGMSSSDKGGDKSEPRKAEKVTNEWGDPNFDFWVVKVDASGKKQWDRTFGGLQYDAIEAIYQTSDGGYILAGNSDSDKSGDKSEPRRGGACNPEWGDYCPKDFWVVKIDAAGNKQWDRTIGGNKDEFLSSVLQLPDGGYLLAGSSTSDVGYDKTGPRQGGAVAHDIWAVKLDATGSKEWDRTFKGIEVPFSGVAMELTSDGGIILGSVYGTRFSADNPDPNQTGFEYRVLKIDALGNQQWERTFGGTHDDVLTSITKTADGGFLLGGTSLSGKGGDKSQPSIGQNDYWLVKIDATGSKQWDRTIGGEKADRLVSIAPTVDGDFIVAGVSNSDASGDKSQNSLGERDYWVVKVDAVGNKIWDATIGGKDDDVATSVAVSPNGGYVISGFTYFMYLSEADFSIIKLKDNEQVAKPQIAAFTPGSGLPGAIVTLTGKHLLTTSAVTFNGVNAGFRIVNDCEIKIAVPAAATTGNIEVTTTGGSVKSAGVFTVLQPSIAKLTPAVGAVGSRFAIRGNHLSSAKQVLVNGVAVTEFTVVDNTLIRAVVPPGATTGKVALVLKGGAKAQSSESFRVITPGAEKVAGVKKLVAYPNPFVAGVTLPVSLDKAGPVSMLIYNTKGQQVKELNFLQLQAGEHQLNWDGKDSQNHPVNDGLYFYKVSVNGKIAAGQLLKSGKANR